MANDEELDQVCEDCGHKKRDHLLGGYWDAWFCPPAPIILKPVEVSR